MAKRVGLISINLLAGTAKFNADMEAARAKIRNLTGDVQNAQNHLVSGNQAAAGAIRVIENGMGNNLRAVENFLTKTLGLGPALQALFPLVGAAAFAGLMVELGEKVYKAFERMKEAPVRIANAFRELNAPLQLANDELKVTNDRLSIDIAKLEGKHQNTLQLSLDEAKVSADSLAESLDKDLDALQKLLKEEGTGFLVSLFKGSRSTAGDDEGIKRFRTQLAGVMSSGSDNIRNASTIDQKDAAEKTRNLAIAKLYTEELKRQRDLVRDAQTLQSYHEGKAVAPPDPNAKATRDKDGNLYQPPVAAPDQSEFIATHQVTINKLQAEADRVSLMTDDERLKGKKAGLEAAKSFAEQERQALKSAYDRMLDDLEASQSMNASEKLEFRENELREITQFGNRYKELQHELSNEIGRLHQQDYAEGKAAREKDAREEQQFQVQLDRERAKWIELAAEAQKARNRQEGLEGKKPTEPRPDLQQFTTEGNAITRLQGTPVGDVGKIETAGYKTVQIREQEIQNEKDMLALMEKGNYSLGQQLGVREKILEAEIAIGIEQGKNVSAEVIALGRLQHQLAIIKEQTEGWASFFVQMQNEAKTAMQIEQDGIRSSIDALSGSLTRAMTGGKGGFGDAFKQVGRQMVEESIKSTLQQTLGKLAPGVKVKKPTGNFNDPIWVIQRGGAAVGAAAGALGGALGKLGPLFGGAQGNTGVFNFVGGGTPSGSVGSGEGTVVGGSTGGIEDLSSVSFMAGGGDMSADRAYIVGEQGPEILRKTRGTIMNNTDSRRLFNQQNGDQYNIDARGATDPTLTTLRVRQAILAAHADGVATSIQAVNERAKRVPAR